MLNSMFNKCKVKACVHYFLSSFYFIPEFLIPSKKLFSLLRYSNFCNFPLPFHTIQTQKDGIETGIIYVMN